MLSMNTYDKIEDHSNDVDDDDKEDDEDDNWILKEAAEWATTSEKNSQTIPMLSTISVEDESKKAAIAKKDMVKPISVIENDKIRRHEQELSSQSSSWQPSPPSSSRKDYYSLHVTQLSYNATEDDIRQHFFQAGCIGIQAIRLVYDFSQKNAKKFRGVAFVDLSDVQSYEYALQKLHGSLLLSRKINVRPVKSKVELANIVQQTRTIVSEKIRTEKEKKLQSDGSNDKKKRSSPQKKRKSDQSPLESKAKAIQSSPSKRKHESMTISQTKRPANQSSASSSKLTKQQRNRRAAILLSKRKS
jgi:RNA recognition motif-containing protein